MTLPWHAAYAGKRVWITGHTGFKGSWLTLWLARLQAQVHGFALPPSEPGMFAALQLQTLCHSQQGDVRDPNAVLQALRTCEPDIVFHLAAQPLVRESYHDPLTTVHTNILGTAHVLEAVRRAGRPCAVVVVTSDKAYENREWAYGYREDDPMGGHDVYAMSKGAAELVVSSYRRSFFQPPSGVHVATVRAGNVLGGGDWSDDRIIPDAVRAVVQERPVAVRQPQAVRPWQHVLDPLSGYLQVGAELLGTQPQGVAEAWNFGPPVQRHATVGHVVDGFLKAWGRGTWQDDSAPGQVHEAHTLRLCIDKACTRLGWQPRWDLPTTLQHTSHWYRAFYAGNVDMRELTCMQIAAYEQATETPA